MNKQEIIDFMKDCKNVNEWNERRETVMDSFDEIPSWVINLLDHSGLIKTSIKNFYYQTK